MSWFGCKGCEARREDISFLRERVKELESQLAASGDAKAEIARLRVVDHIPSVPRNGTQRRTPINPFINTLHGKGHMQTIRATQAVPISAAQRKKE